MIQDTKKNLDIGLAVRQKMNEQGTTITWLAKQVNCDISNLRKHLYNKHIYPELLLNISIVLKKDFFTIYSDCYKQNTEIKHEETTDTAVWNYSP